LPMHFSSRVDNEASGSNSPGASHSLLNSCSTSFELE
jgi:hypothetical protein